MTQLEIYRLFPVQRPRVSRLRLTHDAEVLFRATVAPYIEANVRKRMVGIGQLLTALQALSSHDGNTTFGRGVRSRHRRVIFADTYSLSDEQIIAVIPSRVSIVSQPGRRGKLVQADNNRHF